jgi:hypothetical protein
MICKNIYVYNNIPIIYIIIYIYYIYIYTYIIYKNTFILYILYNHGNEDDDDNELNFIELYCPSLDTISRYMYI